MLRGPRTAGGNVMELECKQGWRYQGRYVTQESMASIMIKSTGPWNIQTEIQKNARTLWTTKKVVRVAEYNKKSRHVLDIQADQGSDLDCTTSSLLVIWDQLLEHWALVF